MKKLFFILGLFLSIYVCANGMETEEASKKLMRSSEVIMSKIFADFVGGSISELPRRFAIMQQIDWNLNQLAKSSYFQKQVKLPIKPFDDNSNSNALKVIENGALIGLTLPHSSDAQKYAEAAISYAIKNRKRLFSVEKENSLYVSKNQLFLDCVAEGYITACRYFLKEELVKVNFQGTGGNTAAHAVALSLNLSDEKREKFLELLKNSGINFSLKNNDNKTFLEICEEAEKAKRDFVKKLKKRRNCTIQ